MANRFLVLKTSILRILAKDKSRRSVQGFANNNYGGIQELIYAESNLKNYNESIVGKLGFYLNDNFTPKKVLDFGAGTGTLSEIWREKFKTSPICIEIDPELQKTLVNRGFQTFQAVSSLPFKVDSVFTSNVLEHIEDDLEALISIGKSLKEGGRLAIYVPAFQILYSTLDRNVGHFRRYSRKELISKLEKSGFIVERCVYSDSIGFIASLLVKILHFNKDGVLCSKSSLKVYDKIIYPVSLFLDLIGLQYVFGKNLIAFAKLGKFVE